MTSSVAELIDLLRGESLLPAAAHSELAGQFSHPQELVNHLVKRGWLTDWQADELISGRGRMLVLGRYVLLNPLGEGGMGQVFKARHQTLERIDAVKVIRPEHLARPLAVERFLREAKAAARLNHPHLITVYDAGEAGGRYFLAMEYIAGADLERVVRAAGRLPWPRVCRVLHQAALGLQHAHDKGLVHRDLKPSNLIQADLTGQIKILDLGLARFLVEPGAASLDQLTTDNVVLGTPDYMAPEQAADTHQVDIRADLYSLGCTAYHLLAGHVPFLGGSAMEKLLRHRVEQPRPLTEICPKLPEAAARIIGRLLAKAPADRFQDPAELARHLSPLLTADAEADDLPAAPSTLGDSVLRSAAAPSLPRAVGNAATWKQPRQIPGRQRHKARWIAAAAVLSLAALTWTLAGMLPRGQQREAPPVFTKLLWQAGPIFKSPQGALCGVAFSPDAKLLAVAGGDYNAPTDSGLIQILDLEKEQWLPLGEPRCSARLVRFTPDGQTLISVTGTFNPKFSPLGEVTFWNVLERKALQTVKSFNGVINALALEPQGKWLIVAGQDSHLRQIDVPTGQERLLPIPARSSQCLALAVSNDGRLVACGYGNGLVRVLETESWAEHSEFRPRADELTFISGLSFRPGDEQLVGTTGVPAGGDAHIKVWDVARKLRKSTIRHGTNHVFAMALAPAGRTLATASQDGLVRLWDLDTQEQLAELPGHVDPVYALAFANDGRTLASASHGTIRLWMGTAPP